MTFDLFVKEGDLYKGITYKIGLEFLAKFLKSSNYPITWVNTSPLPAAVAKGFFGVGNYSRSDLLNLPHVIRKDPHENIIQTLHEHGAEFFGGELYIVILLVNTHPCSIENNNLLVKVDEIGDPSYMLFRVKNKINMKTRTIQL